MLIVLLPFPMTLASPRQDPSDYDQRQAKDQRSAVTLSRGPYLQLVTASSMIVKWRTSAPTDSVVQYGLAPEALATQISSPILTTEHELTMSGLDAETVHYYSVGDTSGVLAGGDNGHFFRTAPMIGQSRRTHIWVIGDSGGPGGGGNQVHNAFVTQNAGQYVDVWLMLGDNAYTDGTDEQYQAAMFNRYFELLRQTAVWSTFGNHDAISASSSTQTGVYYDIFTHPANAEAGGLPSGTEAYYSFDYGNIHFISLNSQDVSRLPTGAMLIWLQADLADTLAEWVIAYWHHPPYSKGSHDSDNPTDSAGRLIDMRENVLPILEDAGVDLVLSGHSHVYERSFLLDGHYDFSNTLTPAMILDEGDGRIAGDGAYIKSSSGLSPHEGTVYVVNGSSSGATQGAGTLDHPAMFVSLATRGSLIIDIDGNRLDAKFLNSLGVIDDRFRIVKGGISAGDIDGNGAVDVIDLIVLLAAWGLCDPSLPLPPCPADFNGDGAVDVEDLLNLIANWG